LPQTIAHRKKGKPLARVCSAHHCARLLFQTAGRSKSEELRQDKSEELRHQGRSEELARQGRSEELAAESGR
jgi:hypothetical protein